MPGIFGAIAGWVSRVGNMAATPFRMAGAAANMAGKIAAAPFNMAYSVGSTALGPMGLGLPAKLSNGLGRLAIPALIVGGVAGVRTAANALNEGAGYSINSPLVAQGYNPGITTPFPNPFMEFRQYTGDAMNASGSLALALHNRRRM